MKVESSRRTPGFPSPGDFLVLTRREATAFGLAVSTAPLVTCVVFGSSGQWFFTAAVAYVAAFAIGAPLFAYLRYRGWPLGPRSWLAATVAGTSR
jgi:hypothetical protein